MKKLFVLVAVLAMIAVMVVPMAVSAATGPAVTATPNVEVTGNITTPTVTVTAPSNIGLGMFAGVGWSNPAFSATPGQVVITPNSYPDATATLSVQSFNYGAGYDYSAGCMYDGRYMEYPIQMTVADPITDTPVGSGFTYIGNGTSISAVIGAPATFTSTIADPKTFNYKLGAKQYIDANDLANGAGNYTIYVTVTAQVNY